MIDDRTILLALWIAYHLGWWGLVAIVVGMLALSFALAVALLPALERWGLV